MKIYEDGYTDGQAEALQGIECWPQIGTDAMMLYMLLRSAYDGASPTPTPQELLDLASWTTAKRLEKTLRVLSAARAIIIQDDKLLVAHLLEVPDDFNYRLHAHGFSENKYQREKLGAR